MIDYNTYIKKWDEYDCVNHVAPVLSKISDTLKLYYKDHPVTLIDIGANVGKVYDILETKSIINISKAYFFEANTKLYNYMLKKYKQNSKIFIFNEIILNKNIEVNFDDDYIDYEIFLKNKDINFGLSQINMHKHTNKKRTKTISEFIKLNNFFDEYIFIKIDTENSDILILQDILSVIDLLKFRPIIEFEVNYLSSGHTSEFAQRIIDEYVNRYNYQNINISKINGDGLLIPINND